MMTEYPKIHSNITLKENKIVRDYNRPFKDHNTLGPKDQNATVYWKVKQERAQGGCLGTESR